jgi:hypothetical protein
VRKFWAKVIAFQIKRLGHEYVLWSLMMESKFIKDVTYEKKKKKRKKEKEITKTLYWLDMDLLEVFEIELTWFRWRNENTKKEILQ